MMIDWLEEHDAGHKQVNYRLQDWIFSRQRYWGDQFRLSLMTARFPWFQKTNCRRSCRTPTTLNHLGTGESPLANVKTGSMFMMKTVTVVCVKINTMPQWRVLWYWLRYTDPQQQVNLPLRKRWTTGHPVDLCMLVVPNTPSSTCFCRRFEVLYDLGLVPQPETIHELVNQGMIWVPTTRKDVEVQGNVATRMTSLTSTVPTRSSLYEMFMGPLTRIHVPWMKKACTVPTSGFSGFNLLAPDG